MILRNRHIEKSLDRVYNRESKPIPDVLLNNKRISSRSSIRSLNSDSHIKNENKKMVNKISTAKSQYSKFRDSSYSNRSKS